MSDRDLDGEIQEFLEQHGASTSSEVAIGIRAGLASVIDALAPFPFAPHPAGANPRAKFYGAKPSQPFTEATAHTPSRGTHKQRVLDLLRDGRPHSHHELYRLGVIAHSRVSDLRRDGHTIDCWRDGDDSMYRLVGSLDAAPASGNDNGGDLLPLGTTGTGAASNDTLQLSLGDAA